MFKREEDRYLVFKVKDLYALSSLEVDWLDYLDKRVRQVRKFRGKEPLHTVIIESDWPEYEPVWKMIEDRVNGNSRGTT